MIADMMELEAIDAGAVARDLDAQGWAILKRVLTPGQCEDLAGLYERPELFRSRIVMGRHGFGQGEYQYFAYTLPPVVQALRTGLYPLLAPLANRWNEALRLDVRYPETHDAFLARCHAAGQTKPTPLLLRYGADDYNCLHQDVYGAHVFPMQAVVLLSEPGRDFDGGEFVLTEQRPRMQSRVGVVPLRQGDAAIFAVRHRPVCGASGNTYRTMLRHGVSRVRAGRRHAAGIIFHDAE